MKVSRAHNHNSIAGEFKMANMIIEDGEILAGHCAPASTSKTGIAVSTDFGKTWAEYDLAEYVLRSPSAFIRETATTGVEWIYERGRLGGVTFCSSNRIHESLKVQL